MNTTSQSPRLDSTQVFTIGSLLMAWPTLVAFLFTGLWPLLGSAICAFGGILFGCAVISGAHAYRWQEFVGTTLRPFGYYLILPLFILGAMILMLLPRKAVPS